MSQNRHVRDRRGRGIFRGEGWTIFQFVSVFREKKSQYPTLLNFSVHKKQFQHPSLKFSGYALKGRDNWVKNSWQRPRSLVNVICEQTLIVINIGGFKW